LELKVVEDKKKIEIKEDIGKKEREKQKNSNIREKVFYL